MNLVHPRGNSSEKQCVQWHSCQRPLHHTAKIFLLAHFRLRSISTSRYRQRALFGCPESTRALGSKKRPQRMAGHLMGLSLSRETLIAGPDNNQTVSRLIIAFDTCTLCWSCATLLKVAWRASIRRDAIGRVSRRECRYRRRGSAGC